MQIKIVTFGVTESVVEDENSFKVADKATESLKKLIEGKSPEEAQRILKGTKLTAFNGSASYSVTRDFISMNRKSVVDYRIM